MEQRASGSTDAGRFEAQLDLLNALVEFRDAHPEGRVDSAVSQVLVSRDKVFMAQSHEFANITEFAAALENHAASSGRDAQILVDGIMRTAVQEGPASVEALQGLLEFKSSKFSHYDQLRASLLRLTGLKRGLFCWRRLQRLGKPHRAVRFKVLRSTSHA